MNPVINILAKMIRNPEYGTEAQLIETLDLFATSVLLEAKAYACQLHSSELKEYLDALKSGNKSHLPEINRSGPAEESSLYPSGT